jgi:hypothetical protein
LRTKDIKVGEHYRYGEYGPREVEVLETGVERWENNRYDYSRRRKVKNGVRVKYAENGHVGTVVSRDIIGPWSEYAELNEARDKHLREEFNAKKEKAQRRAALAYRLEPILRDNGFEPRLQYVAGYGTGHARVALEAAGYPAQAGPFNDGQKDHFLSAVPNLETLMEKGLVTEDVAALLLDRLESE